MEVNKILQGDCLEILKTLPSESVDMVITSPPYWSLRDYGMDAQLGLEKSFEEYISKLCDVFDEVKRVLKKDGTCWVNMGDTYGTQSGAMRDGKFGPKNTNNQKFVQPKSIHKCLLQIPSRFAIEMCQRGWILRNEIIWHKPNAMPQSITDRFTVDFEKIFFFVKSKKYYFETQHEPYSEATIKDKRIVRIQAGIKLQHTRHKNYKKAGVQDPSNVRDRGYASIDLARGRNMRSVWKIPTKSFKEAHFAVYPESLITTPIKAGCPAGGIVLDPFFGSGTTGVVAKELGRNYLGIELNPDYILIANERLSKNQKSLFVVTVPK